MTDLTFNKAESDRLAALRRYKVLDTPSDAKFDEVVRLAALACDAPIGLLGFIDADRVWYKARHGWSVSQTDRLSSAAQYVLLGPEITIIRDATSDFRFQDNPQVASGAQIKFYAGVPLVTADGFRIGVLSVLDTEARDLSDVQRTGLEGLAQRAMRLVEGHS